MLLYCDYNQSKTLSVVEQDSDLYKHLVRCYTGLNLEIECINKTINDQSFDLILLKTNNKEYLCRYYGHVNGPVIINKDKFECFQEDKEKFKTSRYIFECISCEFYEIFPDQLKLKTIITYDENNEYNQDENDGYIKTNFYSGDINIITYFQSLNYLDYKFNYHYDDETKREFDECLFFYNYVNKKVDKFEYFFDSGVYNINLFYKTEDNNEDNNEEYSNKIDTFINDLIKKNDSYHYELFQKEQTIINYEKELHSFIELLNEKKKEITETDKNIIQMEKNLLKKESIVYMKENKLIKLKKQSKIVSLQELEDNNKVMEIKLKLKENEIKIQEQLIKEKKKKLNHLFVNYKK
jgi:hypothetical protein